MSFLNHKGKYRKEYVNSLIQRKWVEIKKMSNLAVALVACSILAVAVIIIGYIITRNTKLPSPPPPPPPPPRPLQLRTPVYRTKDGDLVILTGAGTAISVAGAVIYGGSSGCGSIGSGCGGGGGGCGGDEGGGGGCGGGGGGGGCGGGDGCGGGGGGCGCGGGGD